MRFLLLLFLPWVVELQANLAGVVDWHKALIGEPLLEPSPPSLVETSRGRRVVTLTKENVFGVLDEYGEIGGLGMKIRADDSMEASNTRASRLVPCQG